MRRLVLLFVSTVALAGCGHQEAATPVKPSPPQVSSATSLKYGVIVTVDQKVAYVFLARTHGVSCGDVCQKTWRPVATSSVGLPRASFASARVGGAPQLTYRGWPLYTYAGDSHPGQTNGEAVSSFGGTWYVLSYQGTPVLPPQMAPPRDVRRRNLHPMGGRLRGRKRR